MRIGVVFPQTELGGDVGAVRAYGEGVEALGFTHLLAYDHVVGADPQVHEGWAGPYDVSTTFHEPFVLFGYLAAVTTIELVTGIIILPQRQTVLVAKQAAEVDLLTGGRFRLGVGLGWNEVEYQALGKDFGDRGRRMSEQIPLLRRLWTERSVTSEGADERIRGAGLAPLPVQRPIPVWIGAASEPAYRRVGRLADGWFPQVRPGADLDAARAVIATAAAVPAATPRPSPWRAGSRGTPTIPTARCARWSPGARRGRPTSRSTPCAGGWPPSAITWRCCARWRSWSGRCADRRPPGPRRSRMSRMSRLADCRRSVGQRGAKVEPSGRSGSNAQIGSRTSSM